MNCTACKRLILALALAAEDGVGGFSWTASGMQFTSLARYEAFKSFVIPTSTGSTRAVLDTEIPVGYISHNLNDGVQHSCQGPAEFSSMSVVIPRLNSYKCQVSSTHFC
jgi:hypothetical protein